MKVNASKFLVLNSLRAALVVAALLVIAPNLAAQTTADSANGHGTLLVQNSDGEFVRRQFSFNAKRRADGTVTGSAVLHNPGFEINGKQFQAKIDISCLKVVGNIAILGGFVRRTNDPGFVDAVFFTVQDNGEPGKDRDKISRVFLFDDNATTTGNPQLCQVTGATDFPLETIESGNIQVRGGTQVP